MEVLEIDLGDYENVFVTVEWSIRDLKVLFDRYKIPYTKKNIDQFLKSRALKVLEEMSIKGGWDVLDALVAEYSRQGV